MARSASTTNSIAQIIKEFVSWPRRSDVQSELRSNGAYVLGIAGCSNSGKTTLSNTLLTALVNEGFRATVLSQDAFYYPEEQLERIMSRTDPKISFYNYDTIKALDTVRFLSSLQKSTLENDFVIVEGNMIIEIDSLRHLLHRSLFITLNHSLFEQRRATRGYNPVDLPGYVEEVVWPAYRKHLANAHGLARRSSAIVFVDGNVQGFSSECEIMTLFSKLSKNLLLVQANELQLSYVVEFVRRPESGGTTRDKFGDKQVTLLEYEAYDEMVYKELDSLCHELRKSYPEIDRIALIHRVGKVFVREASVIIAVSATHRQDAFRGTERAIDHLKSRVPIWKKEVYSDGTFCWKRNS